MDGQKPVDFKGVDPRPFSRRSFVGLLAVFVASNLYLLSRRWRQKTLTAVFDGPLVLEGSVEIPSSTDGFVTPEKIYVTEFDDSTAIFNVMFTFVGREIPSRRVEVMLIARSSDGKILSRGAHTCRDQRIFARENAGQRDGTLIPWIDPRNCESFRVPMSLVEQIRRIELKFREV